MEKDKIYLHNYMEDIVYDEIEKIFSKDAQICKCIKCKTDIAAIALNKLPPKYVVTQKGRVYTKLEELSAQACADVIKEVARAVEKIKNNPRH